MGEQGSGGSSGFEWILARLPAAVRDRHCVQALQEELTSVQTRVSACCEAVAHAEQVAAAIAALEAQNQQTAAILRAPGTDALLMELRELQRGFRVQLDTLLQSFAASGNSAMQHTLLTGIQDTVASRNGKSRLSEAVELAQAFAESCTAEQLGQEDGADGKLKLKTKKKWRKAVAALRALRTALVEQADAHVELLPLFATALRTLRKRNVVFESFCKESERLLRATERSVAEKQEQQQRTERHAKKKRKLSDANVASSASSARHERTEREPARPTPTAPPASASTLSTQEARALLAKCSRGVRTLREQFTKELFDETLEQLEALTASLSTPAFNFEVVRPFSANVFAVVEHVEKVKQPVKRKNRLLRLEAVLEALASDTSGSLSRRGRAMVYEYLANCQNTLSHLRASLESASTSASVATEQPSASSSGSKALFTTTTASRPAAQAVANPIVREAERVKQETKAAPKPRPAPAQPPAPKKAKVKNAHVHFDK